MVGRTRGEEGTGKGGGRARRRGAPTRPYTERKESNTGASDRNEEAAKERFDEGVRQGREKSEKGAPFTRTLVPVVIRRVFSKGRAASFIHNVERGERNVDYSIEQSRNTVLRYIKVG